MNYQRDDVRILCHIQLMTQKITIQPYRQKCSILRECRAYGCFQSTSVATLGDYLVYSFLLGAENVKPAVHLYPEWHQ
jgi:hypothetical protein